MPLVRTGATAIRPTTSTRTPVKTQTSSSVFTTPPVSDVPTEVDSKKKKNVGAIAGGATNLSNQDSAIDLYQAADNALPPSDLLNRFWFTLNNKKPNNSESTPPRDPVFSGPEEAVAVRKTDAGRFPA
ncbi:hypothetical protein V5O48_011565 [Marasmius crinis-equi]|uniref:Uncharacterized protein n=1 Tax=Marasmius crinis-equi TaxID=585013 RepID=A0ABR3F5H3_9AGAR